MKVACEVCEEVAAAVLLVCCKQEGYEPVALCLACHAAKTQRFFLQEGYHSLSPVESHQQAPICDICQERSSLILCMEDRALLCHECDVCIHTANALSTMHKRCLLDSGFGVNMNPCNTTLKASSSLVVEPVQVACPSSISNNKHACDPVPEKKRLKQAKAACIAIVPPLTAVSNKKPMLSTMLKMETPLSITDLRMHFAKAPATVAAGEKVPCKYHPRKACGTTMAPTPLQPFPLHHEAKGKQAEREFPSLRTCGTIPHHPAESEKYRKELIAISQEDEDHTHDMEQHVVAHEYNFPRLEFTPALSIQRFPSTGHSSYVAPVLTTHSIINPTAPDHYIRALDAFLGQENSNISALLSAHIPPWELDELSITPNWSPAPLSNVATPDLF